MVGNATCARPEAERCRTFRIRLAGTARRPSIGTAHCPTVSRTLGVILMPERHITVQRRMSASTGSVWALYADFPNLANHWSGLRATRAIGDQTSGVGARRRVDLKPIGSMDETVTTWEEGRRIDTQNQPSVSVPFKQAESTLTLLSLIHISEPTRRTPISYAVF